MAVLAAELVVRRHGAGAGQGWGGGARRPAGRRGRSGRGAWRPAGRDRSGARLGRRSEAGVAERDVKRRSEAGGIDGVGENRGCDSILRRRLKWASEKIVPIQSGLRIGPFGSIIRLYSMESAQKLFQTGP